MGCRTPCVLVKFVEIPFGPTCVVVARSAFIVSYPIVLVPGACPFDVAWNKRLSLETTERLDRDRLHYFKGIRLMLRSHGFDTHHGRTSWAAPVHTRATDLKKRVSRVLRHTGAAKVHIIAHSMGGLDSRHMLFHDRQGGKIHERVASLTTISTPHLGSPYADWSVSRLPFVFSAARYLGIDLRGLKDLQTHRCGAYHGNPDVVAFEKACEETILFQTYAGVQSYRYVWPSFRRPYRIIYNREGENDGLVSVQSAMWRDRYFQGVIPSCDHLNEVGWWHPGNFFFGESPRALLQRIHRFYLGIAQRLPGPEAGSW